MMDSIVKRCKERGLKRIRGYYYPTAKNGMVRDFFAVQGFEKVSGDEGGTEWVLDINEKYENKNNVIEVED